MILTHILAYCPPTTGITLAALRKYLRDYGAHDCAVFIEYAHQPRGALRTPCLLVSAARSDCVYVCVRVTASAA